MYCEGLQLQVLYKFDDHDGFSGIMVGLAASILAGVVKRRRRAQQAPAADHS